MTDKIEVGVNTESEAAGYEKMATVFDFFFSSRRRHTSFDCDWSSDVCSSDLQNTNTSPGNGGVVFGTARAPLIIRLCDLHETRLGEWSAENLDSDRQAVGCPPSLKRSEERRVGKECRTRWSAR